MLVDGLKKMNGGLELLLQLANFDFGKWLAGCVSKSFTNYGCVSLCKCVSVVLSSPYAHVGYDV
eukprot:5392350-Pleurochrysis_carterae.AAC.1